MGDTARHALENSLAFRLHQATVLVDRAADRYLRTHHGISYSLLVVLLVVAVREHPTQQEIATMLTASRSSITQRVAGLVERGLVRVAPHPSDARAVEVRLTPEGGVLLGSAWQGLETADASLDDGVDTARLTHELDILIANTRRHLAAPEAPR